MVRIGHGFDLHLVAPGRKLILGATPIPWHSGLAGHSDADVVLHAVIDAVLGALALGDIGQWFPDADEQYRNADSAQLLKTVLAADALKQWRLGNLDITVLAERPRLAEHIPFMRQRIAEIFASPVNAVSVKATTCEGVDAVGKGQAISAHAVVILTSNPV